MGDVPMTYWQGSNLSFWLVTALVLTSAATAALSRNIVRAAFSLFFTLAGMAGYYVLLGSAFVAVTQVVIYVGGILVLLMFGVLLTNREAPHERFAVGKRILAPVTALLFFLVVLVPVISGASWVTAPLLTEPAVSVKVLGRALLDQHLLAFELAGMTLLLCLVGAAWLVRREK